MMYKLLYCLNCYSHHIHKDFKCQLYVHLHINIEQFCYILFSGKHISMDCPKYGGSQYFNYKGFHSTVLLAVCDANYKFIYVNIGSYGRDNDASIFSQSQLYKAINTNTLNIPPPEPLQGVDIPYFLVGDDIFALKPWLMKPYPGTCNEQQHVFNYRLSRARRTIENAFGILAARWRIFRKPIRADVTTIDQIVKAAVCLHNYLLSTDNARYTPTGFVDSYSSEGIVEGDWRRLVDTDRTPAMANIRRIATRNYTLESKEIRDHLKNYVIGDERCPWQLKHVSSCGKRTSQQ